MSEEISSSKFFESRLKPSKTLFFHRYEIELSNPYFLLNNYSVSIFNYLKVSGKDVRPEVLTYRFEEPASNGLFRNSLSSGSSYHRNYDPTYTKPILGLIVYKVNFVQFQRQKYEFGLGRYTNFHFLSGLTVYLNILDQVEIIGEITIQNRERKELYRQDLYPGKNKVGIFSSGLLLPHTSKKSYFFKIEIQSPKFFIRKIRLDGLEICSQEELIEKELNELAQVTVRDWRSSSIEELNLPQDIIDRIKNFLKWEQAFEI